MKISGKRVYSNEEIRQMAMVGFDTNFVEYLRTAPDRVKKIVENMLSSEQARTELRATYDIDGTKTPILEEKYEQLEMSILDEAIEVHDNSEDGRQEIEEPNPYIDMDFTQRLEINELRVTITSDTKCRVHGNQFEKLQVVLLYGGGKRYGSYLQCCSKCKRLFATEDEFKELEIRLIDKNIRYSIEL